MPQDCWDWHRESYLPIKKRVAAWVDPEGVQREDCDPLPDLKWGENDDKPTTGELIDRIFADCLGFLFVHCFTPEGCSLDIAIRRFLALVYIYRPDLIEGRSVADIAKEIHITKGAIGQQLSAMRKEIGATGINSMEGEARRRVRAGQMRARLARAKTKTASEAK